MQPLNKYCLSMLVTRYEKKQDYCVVGKSLQCFSVKKNDTEKVSECLSGLILHTNW